MPEAMADDINSSDYFLILPGRQKREPDLGSATLNLKFHVFTMLAGSFCCEVKN